MDDYGDFFICCKRLLATINAKEKIIEELLLGYEPIGTARDEIERSVSTLEGLEDEFINVQSMVRDLTISTFFPLNLPLYSVVLFAVIPSAFAERVYVRAPANMQTILTSLIEALDLKSILPNIIVRNTDRKTFMELYVKDSDVILFTGKYENALMIHEQCPHALLIFNGSGVNPAIVFEDANVPFAAQKIFEMRTFNSGQDCAGTDAIFVHSSVVDSLVEEVKEHISKVVVGDYGNRETHIGPIQKKEYIEGITKFFAKENGFVVYGGQIDRRRAVVHPTLIVKRIDEHTGNFHEFFAPVFYILTFETEEQLLIKLREPVIYDFSMYISYFGDNKAIEEFDNAQLLHNQIVNDVEQGNHEYGGYGSKANFVMFGGRTAARPILISREIDRFYVNDGIA